MKKILAIMLALTLLCLAGCGKKTDAAEEQAAAADAQETPTEEVAAEPEVEVKSVTISNEEGDAEMKIEYQALDGLTYEEYDNYGTPCIRFEYEPENISMTLFIDALNTGSLHDSIEGNGNGEPVAYGDVKGFVEFSSWAATIKLELGPQTDAVSYIANVDIRRLDTYQADSEDELRGFMENDAVTFILSSLELAG